MKLSKVLTIVVSAHTCIVALILFQPGCKTRTTEPDYSVTSATTTTGKPDVARPLSVANAGDSQNRVIVHRDFDIPEDVPAATPEQIKEPVNRYQPSRPPIQQWNVIQDSEPEVIAGNVEYDTDSLSEFNPPVSPLEPISAIEPVNSGNLNPDLSSSDLSTTYTVVKGDNLTKIARTHGIELAELMRANDLNKRSILRIGQVLVIPNPQPGLNPTPPVAADFETTSAEVESSLYIVVPGDNLSKIAQRFNTTVSAIKSANGLASDRIYAGQDLLIPKQTASTRAAPATDSTENDTGMTYKVRKGDTLGKIAHRFGVRVGDLMQANGITDPRRLRAGQTIRVPAGSIASKSMEPVAPALRPQSAPSQNQTAPQAPAAPVAAPKPPSTSAPAQSEPLEEIDLDDVPHVPVYGE